MLSNPDVFRLNTSPVFSCRFGQLPNLVLGTGFFSRGKSFNRKNCRWVFWKKVGKVEAFPEFISRKRQNAFPNLPLGWKLRTVQSWQFFLVWHSSGHEKHLQLSNMISFKRWVVILHDPKWKGWLLGGNSKGRSKWTKLRSFTWPSWPKRNWIVIPETRYSPVNRHTLGNRSPNMGVTRFPIRQHPKLQNPSQTWGRSWMMLVIDNEPGPDVKELILLWGWCIYLHIFP